MIASRPSHHAGIGWGLVGLLAFAAMTACSAGQITQTASQVGAIPGANANASPNSQITLRDLVVAYNGPGGYPVGSSAPLVVRIFNNGLRPVTLTRVDASDTARTVALVSGGVTGGGPAAADPTTASSPSPTSSPAPVPTGSLPAGSPSTATPGGSAQASPSPLPNISSSSAGPTSAPAEPAGLPVTIGPASYVLLVPGQGPFLQLVGLTRPITSGTSVTVRFDFADGSTAIVAVPFGVPLSAGPRSSPAPGQGEGG